MMTRCAARRTRSKGSLGTLHAPRAFAAAARLEEIARQGENVAVFQPVSQSSSAR